MGSNTTLKVTIIGDSKSAQRAMGGLESKSGGLVSKLGTVAGTVGKAFGGAALVAGGLGIAAGKMGLEVAAGNEQAKIAFTTMLGSGKKADKFLRDLQAFAAATPFEFPELQTAASSLISAGIEANKVIPIMTTLGDVTSGMGTGSEGVKRATVALQQMSAAGKISGEDLNQLRDAGIPVYDLLSKATGKSKAEVVKLAQAGKLGTKELGQMMKALETGKGLERFSGLMKKQSSSLTGLWSTMKDTLGQGLAKAIEPLIPLIKDGLGAASDALAKILPKVATGLKNAVTWAKKFATEFQNGTGAGGKFKEILMKIKDALQSAWNIGKSVTGWLIEHKGAVEAASVAVGALVAITKVHATVMKVQAAGGILKMIQSTKLITGLTKTWTAVQWLMNLALTANPIGLLVVGIGLLIGAVVLIATKTKWFQTAWKVMTNGIGDAWRWVWNSIIAPVIRWIVGGFASIAQGIASFLRGLSGIPGFGWAKSAADKMQGAATAAKRLANNIKDIPPRKDAKVVTTFTYPGYSAALSKQNDRKLALNGIRGNATGGTSLPAGLSWVGERGPELMYVPGGSSIYNARDSARMARAPHGGSSGSGGGSAAPTVVVNVAGHVMTERDLVALLRNELVKMGRRNGGVIFPK